jgi:ribosomal protein L40E
MEYCTNCGTEVPDNANYCSKCGLKIGSKKKEEAYETDRMKSEISSIPHESYRSSKHELLESIRGGFIILILGILLIIAASGNSSSITMSNYFAYFLVGSGVILIAIFFVHLLLSDGKFYKYGDFFGGIILFTLGILLIYGFDRYFWYMAIAGVGIYSISVRITKFLAGKKPSV